MNPGTLENWMDGLAALANRGPTAFPALALVGLSVCAPLVPEAAGVNPVLGLVGPASPFQAAALLLALSVWGDPLAKARNQGPKAGLADLACAPAGEALSLDGLGRFAGNLDELGGRLCFLLAGEDPLGKDGPAWRGVGFYVSDRPLAHLLPHPLPIAFTEVTQAPFPESQALTGFVQEAARHNFGHAGELIRAHLASLGPEGVRESLGSAALGPAWPISPTACLAGEGLRLLADALHAKRGPYRTDLWAVDVMSWLADEQYKQAVAK